MRKFCMLALVLLMVLPSGMQPDVSGGGRRFRTGLRFIPECR